MLELTKILVPTDFEKAAQNAYVHASQLAEKFGGSVDLLHVVPTHKYFHESMKTVGYPLSLEDDVYPKITKKAKEHIAEEMTKYIDEKYRGETIVKIGPKPSEVILETAKKIKADMIVMGGHNNDPSEMILGTVTDRVIRRAQIPVLSIPPDINAESVNNIVIPTDFSDHSLKSVFAAVRFAASMKATITFLHVMELYGNYSESQHKTLSRDESNDMRKRMYDRIKDYLKENSDNQCTIQSETSGDEFVFQDNGNEVKIPVKLEVTRGISSHYEIVDYANNNADMVVITTHGRSGLAHFFLGSTTEKVIRWSRKPVLTIRSITNK